MATESKIIIELKKFGSLAIEGFGSEEVAAEKLGQLNELLAQDPKILSALTKKSNIEAFNEMKQIAEKKGEVLTKIPAIINVVKKFSL
jgi:hypothetical protein